MPAKLTKEDIIKRAIEIHGEKYDYSLIEKFKNNRTKVDIICKKHGIFSQTIFNHLQGSGCNECGKEKKSLSHEDYIKYVSELYDGFYDYKKTKYTRQSDKITITCPLHGDFVQKALSHYQNHGCIKCGNISRVAKKATPHDEFISKCKEIHGDLYDYSNTKYTSSRSKVNIICKIHGEFFQTAKSHLSGSGCVVCGHTSRSELKSLLPDEILYKFNQTHGNLYIYSLTEEKYYLQDSVDIICNTHGIFKQEVSSHIAGAGCTLCGTERRVKKASSNLDEFIKKACSIHGSKYDYTKTNYKSTRTKVDIICKIHGNFTQLPKTHLTGGGCPTCAIEQSKMNTCEFINRSNNIHNGKYVYERTKYVHSKEKITVTCKEHGDFSIIPTNHLNGGGCVKCAKTGYRPEQPGYYYIHEITSRISDTKYYKLGITKNIDQRLKQYKNNVLQTSKFKAFFSEDGIVIQELERYIKKNSGIEMGVVPKNLYESGYTETINSCDIYKVLDIIEQFMSKHSNGSYISVVNI